MSQFTLYRNNNKSSNKTYPYFIDIQNDLLRDLNSRVVIPLSPYDPHDKTDAKKLCPVIKLNDKGDFVLLTHQITSVPKSILKTEVTSLDNYRYEILGAIDILFSGI
ncbi:MAG: CcdB family protein [Thiohalomonadales bacterium]